MEKVYVHFMQVAYQGSISQASAALNITQPAISKSIKTLEKRYKTPLFVRNSKGVEITPAGTIVLERCKRMENELQAMASDIEDLFSQHDRIKIGSGPAWEMPLCAIISDFLLRFPNSRMMIESDTISQLIPRMLSGELDIALGGEDSIGLDVNKELTFIPLIDTRLCIVAHESHKLAHMKKCKLDQLVHYPWIAYQHSEKILEHVNQLLDREQVAPVRFTLETEFMEVALMTLCKNDGLMCISHTLYEKVRHHGIVELVIDEPIWSYHIGAWVPPAYKRTPLVNEFINAISQQAELYNLNHSSPLL
ncbi:LysR family transcriptional regulator [Vibrio sp. E150_011]